jgi:predicted HicB family RNase H-like nuclease
MGPELHHKIYISTIRSDKSINKWAIENIAGQTIYIYKE